ncbi:MAG: adenosylcobinamide amidohydrolase [Betaproteobacteria bacterium]|nr:adenosylcobinamide amidohydrolase [Betaproteobacteria bacterium]
MNAFSRLALCSLLFLSAVARAEDIDIPADVGAEVQILRSERDGYWEKRLVVRFPEARRTLSTSDGLLDARAALNHASHPQLWYKLGIEFMGRDGRSGKAYGEYVHTETARQLQLDKSAVAHMATAADMDNLAIVTRHHGPLTVTVLATAGTKSNAIRTGVDAGTYIEGHEPAGTINILVLTNIRLTDAALARALITVTEGKTAALQDLNVPSTYTPSVQATGTGTDSIIVVSGTQGTQASYTGGHSRIGELIGKSSYEAVIAALGKQNGLFLPGSQRFLTTTRTPPKAPDALRFALLHLDAVPGDIAGNRSRIEAGIREAVGQGADWIVTPELAETGYNFAKRIGTNWIAPYPDAWISKLSAIARDNHVALFIGFAERDAQSDKLHNSVAVIDRDGSLRGTYRKQRPIGSVESWSTAGAGSSPFVIDGIPVGVLICADTYWPEPAARLREQGAAILLAPSAWPPVEGMGPGEAWERRSAETGLPLIVNNRTGREPELDFSAGESVVASGGQRRFAFSAEQTRLFYVDWDRRQGFSQPAP